MAKRFTTDEPIDSRDGSPGNPSVAAPGSCVPTDGRGWDGRWPRMSSDPDHLGVDPSTHVQRGA
jgi:hypothetical protein